MFSFCSSVFVVVLDDTCKYFQEMHENCDIMRMV